MKTVKGISWRPEVLETLDKYSKSLLGATDAGFSDGAGHRSAVVNNLVARELRRLGYPVKYAAVKGGRK